MTSSARAAASLDPVTIEGNGFQHGEPVVLMLQIDGNLSIVLGGARGAQVIADEDGSFTITFDEIGMESRLITRAVGQRPFVAMGSDGSKASVPVQIVNGSQRGRTMADDLQPVRDPDL